MRNRVVPVLFAALLAFCFLSSSIEAQPVVTQPFPGITYITRTDTMPYFRCPGCGAPPDPRLARMNIVLIDLNNPAIHFKLTPQGTNLPEANAQSAMPGWPVVQYETARQPTLAYLQDSHAQLAINSHFFAPFPPPGTSNQSAYAYLIGLAASRGNVYSAFESPIQNYAIVTDAPAVNIDKSNNAGIVHRDPNFADGKHVVENVQLWNALAGSAQIVTNGAITIPTYKDATHPDDPLTPNSTYTRAGRHWYDLSNARTAIGLTQDNRTLVLFTVDGTNGGHGMLVGEVADLLIREYGVYNALNLDGGGSVTIALEDPVTHVKKVMNSPAENPPRSEGSNFAVYSDAVPPVTTATVSPAPNANGWNNTSVTVSLSATDLASGYNDTPTGWVDQLQYSLGVAQPQVIPGSSTSFAVSTTGVTPVEYFATDAAGNDETKKNLAVQIDDAAPAIKGLPGGDCTLWPPNHEIRQVTVVTAEDLVSGVGSFDVTATSSEPSDPNDPDVVITSNGSGGFTIGLRAERLGTGSGRTYTITAVAKDLADNVRTMTASCTVAHDQGTEK